MSLTNLLSHPLTSLGDDLVPQLVLQSAVTDEHEAELVGDAQEVEKQAELVVTVAEADLVVLHEEEEVTGDVTQEVAVVQTVEELGWVRRGRGEEVDGLRKLLLGDHLNGDKSLFKYSRVFLCEFGHQSLDGVETAVLKLVII